ncbi:kinase [Maribius pontilimi]|uniref:Kinase n=1 Tax=Palleronia pontilimi TaxID=1964209 RepID=A0A934IH22_9RHOB|nr:PfkB family carbohydrate kinase [Palleronia pontilimi]MBJ3762957.1 kinase [Palleronia pontilimi]
MDSRVICIGSVLWDTIGRTSRTLGLGNDVAGYITRDPGGVALNIAVGLARLGASPELLSAVGRDVDGQAILEAARVRGVGCDLVYVSEDLPTDRYMAIEGGNGLIAAVADAHSLEAAGDKILAPLVDGRLGDADTPFDGVAALDGNLSEDLLAHIADGPWLARADLRVAPASPGKALRLLPLLRHPSAVFYVNLEEAGLMLGAPQPDTAAAARALVARGASRALVTHGADPCAMADASGVLQEPPPLVTVTRVTGAGDTFMAAHIAAELSGARGAPALHAALAAAAAHVSGESPV